MIRRSKVRGVKDTPSGSVVSIVTCDDNSETVEMMFLVVEEKGAGIVEDNVHTHKLTRKAELLNTVKVYRKQGAFIIDVKKDLVVIITDICLEFRFSSL